MIRDALTARGIRYRWGGTSRGGFDCSGFTRYLMARNLGINLPHSASAQSHYGQKVAIGELQEGDLVFFRTYRRGISHVGVYVGDNPGYLTDPSGRVPTPCLAWRADVSREMDRIETTQPRDPWAWLLGESAGHSKWRWNASLKLLSLQLARPAASCHIRSDFASQVQRLNKQGLTGPGLWHWLRPAPSQIPSQAPPSPSPSPCSPPTFPCEGGELEPGSRGTCLYFGHEGGFGSKTCSWKRASAT